MKSIIFLMITVTVSFSFGQEQSEDWVKLSDLDQINCVSSVRGSLDEFVVNYKNIKIFSNMIRTVPWQDVIRCERAILFAREGNKAVYLNLSDGNMIPENGYFKRIKPF